MCPGAAVLFFPLNPLRAGTGLESAAGFQHPYVIGASGGHMQGITVTSGGRLVFTVAHSESTCHQPERLAIRTYLRNRSDQT